MVNKEYANAYSEVLEILNYIPKSDYNKIPTNMIKLFTINKNKKYSFNYDVNKTLNEQNVSKKAKTIIAILFRDYWATEYQKEKILAKEKYDMEQIECKKREKYSSDNIFKNQDIKENKVNKNTQNHEVQMVKYKENLFTKFMNWIKRILKR